MGYKPNLDNKYFDWFMRKNLTFCS
jgi:hypothetical protein